MKVRKPPVPLSNNIVNNARKLARADMGGGLRINVWPTASGFQANVAVKRDGDSWTTVTRQRFVDALEEALATKVKLLRLDEE